MAETKVFYLTNTDKAEEMGPPILQPNKRRKTTKFPSLRPNTKQKDPKPKSDKAIMVIGVDFGTTYSGFATAMAGTKYNDFVVNKSWPNCAGHREKVPSMISYNMRNPSQRKVTAWGYGTKSSEHTYTWFKLGLGNNQIQEEFDDELLYEGLGSIKCPDNMSYMDLTTDYLRVFYEHMMAKIKTQVGEPTFELLAFHFVLAVPAGWLDEKGGRNIKSCAEEAGFTQREGDTISLIAEPEAAALAAFHSYDSTLESGRIFQLDTNVMIVDMGGGTVDLITYAIKQLKPFSVAEACVGSGAKCGSSTIDRHFQKMMEERFGGTYTTKPSKFIGPKSIFMNEFESLKRRFDMDTDTDVLPLVMDLETSEYYDADDAEVILTSTDLAELFKPVLENVIGLIKEQAVRTKAENEFPISAILLCGGLAESKYVQSQLKTFCQEFIPCAQVIVPPSPWSAICCGAAMRESGKSFISSRRARRSYGTVLLEPFIEDEHKEEDATEHPELGTMVQKMFWHVKRNEKLLSREKYRWLKNATLHVGGKFGYQGVIEIYQSDNVDAPVWKSVKGVRRLGHLPIDLSDLGRVSKRKKQASISYIPGSLNETESVKVEIGQVIRDFMTVEFVARVGSKKVGLASFEYEPIANGEESEDDNPDYWLHQRFNAE